MPISGADSNRNNSTMRMNLRSQSAIFVDAGYLIAAAATRLTGSSLRRGVDVDYEQLVQKLIELVEGKDRLPLLRVYWYDAGKNSQPDSDQERVAGLSRVKLRLGRVGVEGEQKGVDLRIGLDMVGHSRNGAVDTIYLLSGDDDLTEAVEEAQAQGVQVTVLAVPAKSGNPHGVSRHLVKAADGVEILPVDIIDGCFAVKRLIPRQPSKPASSHIPTPADLARRGPSGLIPKPNVVYSATRDARPYIAPEYQHDSAELKRAIKRVVRKAYNAWLGTAGIDQKHEMVRGRPTIPRDLDRALLVDLSEALDDYYLTDDIRVDLRAAFWDAVNETNGY